jgi:cytochrome c-type biogenesis protein CcmH
MIWLWIAAALVSAGLATLVVQRAARAAAAAGGENPALAVYRRQMAELDDLADRGLLADGERRAVRAETGRRLLAAAGREEPPPKAGRPGVVVAAAAAAPLLALIVYVVVGAPGFPDQPFAKRLAEWSHADLGALSWPQVAALMQANVKQHPGDAGRLQALAVAQLNAGQPLEAAQALQRATALAPRDAHLWELLGEVQASAANGEVGVDAQDAFRHALALDPNASAARYALARAKIAQGDVAGGLADWRALEATLAPEDPRRDGLAKEVAYVAAHGALPIEGAAESPAGGGAGGVGPAQIQGMVDGLAARLKADPDDPDGWVRLVRAYGVLGETDRQSAALAQARQRYAGKPDVLAALAAATQPPASPAAVVR